MTDKQEKTYDLYKRNRLSGLPPSQSCEGRSLRSKYERRFRAEIPREEYASLMTPAMIRSHASKNMLAAPVGDADTPVVTGPMAGFVAEDYIYYQLRTRGFEVYRPTYPIRGTDFLIALPNGLYRRIEVKSSNRTGHPHARIRYTTRDGKDMAYDQHTSHIYIVVDMVSKVVLIIPSDIVKGLECIGLSPQSKYWEYKDRYDLIGS